MRWQVVVFIASFFLLACLEHYFGAFGILFNVSTPAFAHIHRTSASPFIGKFAPPLSKLIHTSTVPPFSAPSPPLPAFVMNMDARTDKAKIAYHRITTRSLPGCISRHSGIDGQLLSPDPSSPLRPGEIAYSQNVLDEIARGREMGVKSILHFDDDVLLHRNFTQLFPKLLNDPSCYSDPTNTVLLLGQSLWGVGINLDIHHDAHVKALASLSAATSRGQMCAPITPVSFGSFGVVIGLGRAADKITEFVNMRKKPFDHVYPWLLKQGVKVVVAHPALVIADCTQSDIKDTTPHSANMTARARLMGWDLSLYDDDYAYHIGNRTQTAKAIIQQPLPATTPCPAMPHSVQILPDEELDISLGIVVTSPPHRPYCVFRAVDSARALFPNIPLHLVAASTTFTHNDLELFRKWLEPYTGVSVHYCEGKAGAVNCLVQEAKSRYLVVVPETVVFLDDHTPFYPGTDLRAMVRLSEDFKVPLVSAVRADKSTVPVAHVCGLSATGEPVVADSQQLNCPNRLDMVEPFMLLDREVIESHLSVAHGRGNKPDIPPHWQSHYPEYHLNFMRHILSHVPMAISASTIYLHDQEFGQCQIMN